MSRKQNRRQHFQEHFMSQEVCWYQTKHSTKKKKGNFRPVSSLHIYRVKIPQQNLISHNSQLKRNNHMILSIHAEKKKFDKTHHTFTMKTKNEEHFFKWIKSIYKNPIANIIITLKDFNIFFLTVGSWLRSLLSGLLFFIVLEVLASIKLQEK